MSVKDQVDAAKISEPPAAALPKKKPVIPAPVVEPEPAQPPAAAAPEPAPVKKHEPKKHKKFRVLKDQSVSLNGMLTWVAAGQIIDPLHHHPDAIARLKEQGVELEEVK